MVDSPHPDDGCVATDAPTLDIPVPFVPTETYTPGAEVPAPIAPPQRSLKDWSIAFVSWFFGLSDLAKVVVIGGGTFGSFLLLETVFQLITSLVTVAIFSIGFYGIYQYAKKAGTES
jgi:hypothetical protein